eukprot:763743-Amorphochlora_amoeboformis.AAC.1
MSLAELQVEKSTSLMRCHALKTSNIFPEKSRGTGFRFRRGGRKVQGLTDDAQANEDKKRLYIVAFYAAMDNKKQLFEFQLKDMAEKTNTLLKMLQPPNQKKQKTLEDYEKDGKSIHATTKIVSAFLHKLRRDVKNGMQNPDASIIGIYI